jgi:hypothetical protein
MHGIIFNSKRIDFCPRKHLFMDVEADLLRNSHFNFKGIRRLQK